jgi:hypothetical protein
VSATAIKFRLRLQIHERAEAFPLCPNFALILFVALLRLRLVGDVASAVENVSAAYSDTTVAPHEYFDQTGSRPTSA